MARRFTPQEKKQNRYDRDHVTLGWNSGTKFRKKLRLKKVSAERSLRRKLSVAVHGMRRDGEDDASLSAKPRPMGTSSPPSVREIIKEKTRRREGSHGAKAARRAAAIDSYDWRIEYGLKQILRRRRTDDLERLRDLRAFVRSEMHAGVSDAQLARFFRRHPTWMARLRDWRHRLWSRSRIAPPRPPKRAT